ncbi:hypothetical protein GCM10028793_43960 [Nocardiopsis oceani]
MGRDPAGHGRTGRSPALRAAGPGPEGPLGAPTTRPPFPDSRPPAVAAKRVKVERHRQRASASTATTLTRAAETATIKRQGTGKPAPNNKPQPTRTPHADSPPTRKAAPKDRGPHPLSPGSQASRAGSSAFLVVTESLS